VSGLRRTVWIQKNPHTQVLELRPKQPSAEAISLSVSGAGAKQLAIRGTQKVSGALNQAWSCRQSAAHNPLHSTLVMPLITIVSRRADGGSGRRCSLQAFLSNSSKL
jgi:hypothetical protein